MKPIHLNIVGSWGVFQSFIAELMRCEEEELQLGYKLNTETKGAKPHSVANIGEYQAMQQAIMYKLQKQAGLLKKKQKKTSQMVSSFKPLQVSIMDLRCQ